MIALLLTGLAVLLTAIGAFLSSWIVITAPIFALYPLSVGAPELSPWLLGLNLLAGLLALGLRTSWLKGGILLVSAVSCVISAMPLLQIAGTTQRLTAEIETVLGNNYTDRIPATIQQHWRSQPFSLVDAFRGIPDPPVRLTSGIPFAAPEGVPLTLNVYRPLQVGRYPGVVMIHGGAWRSGNPQDNAQFNRYLAAQGYTVVSISYRLAPTYRFPAQLADVQTALRFIQKHAADYELDADHLVVMGRSAGAHLAMLLAYQPDAPPLRGVVNYYGPVNLERGYYDLPNPDPIDSRAVLVDFLGGDPTQFPREYQAASPGTLVRPNLPPTLLIYGDRDHVVQSKFGARLTERLRSHQNTAVFLNLPTAEHAFDAVFQGVNNQLALYYTERFIAWATHLP